MKTMEIAGVEYIEKKPDQKRGDADGEVCSQCAFAGSLIMCGWAAIQSREKFGGDCVTHDVVFVEKEAE